MPAAEAQLLPKSCAVNVTAGSTACNFWCDIGDRIDVSASGTFAQINGSCGGASTFCSTPVGGSCSASTVLVSAAGVGVCQLNGVLASGSCGAGPDAFGVGTFTDALGGTFPALAVYSGPCDGVGTLQVGVLYPWGTSWSYEPVSSSFDRADLCTGCGCAQVPGPYRWTLSGWGGALEGIGLATPATDGTTDQGWSLQGPHHGGTLDVHSHRTNRVV